MRWLQISAVMIEWEGKPATLNFLTDVTRQLQLQENQRGGDRDASAIVRLSKLRGHAMATFTKIVLYTDRDGRAKFREEQLPLPEGTPQAMLSPVFPSGGYQLRRSPVGFRSQFHCTPEPQWVFILGGEMEIGLQDGSSRLFKPGEHFFSADVLPDGAMLDPKVHGHCSAQRGADPLVTLFVKT